MLLRKQVGTAIGILSLCLFASNAFAIGLGKLTVNSKLDQPFDGIVELTSATSSELASLQAQFADSEDLARSGIKRLGGSSNLDIELVNSGSRAHIRVTSLEAVTDPFMQFVISLTWPKGKVVREYTALIDPPEYGIAGVSTSNAASTQSSATASKTTTAAATTQSSGGSVENVVVKRGDTVWKIISRLRLPAGADEFQMAMALLRANPGAFPNNNFTSLEAGTVLTIPDAADVTSISKSKAAQEFAALDDAKSTSVTVAKKKPVEKVVQKTQPAATTTQVASSAGSADTYGPVKEGETLWSIASRLPPAGGADAYQMSVALLQINPGAFSDGTINSLNGGSVLTIPGIDDLRKVTDQQVSQAFGTPYAGPKVGMSGAAADTQPVVQVVEKPKPVVETTQDDTATSGATQQDNISQPDENFEALVNRINELEESLAPKEEENQALREQIAMLEDQIEQKAASTQAVVENMINEAGEEPRVEAQTDENTTAAEALSSSGGEETTEAVQDATADVVETVSETMTEQTQAVESAGSEVANEVEQVVKNTGASATEAAQNVVSEVVDSDDTTAKTRVTQQASAPWWDRLIPANPIGGIDIKQMGVLAVGVALIGLGTMLFLRRRRSAGDELDDLVPEPSIAPADTMEKSAAIPETAQTVAGSGSIGAERIADGKIDPVAEAEVYVAYGREHEAEQVLRDALTDNPDQPEVKLKLLEVYGRSHNTAAFTALASELKGEWANSKPELWERVVAQGQDLLPGNALFESGEAGTSVNEAPTEIVDTMESAEVAAESEIENSAVPVAASSLELPSKDIGVGNKQIGTTGASSEDEFSIAFDSDGADALSSTSTAAVEESITDTAASALDPTQSTVESVAASTDVVGAESDMSSALDALQSGGVDLEPTTTTIEDVADSVSDTGGDTLLEKAMKRAAPAAAGAAATGAVAAASSTFDDEPSLSDLSASIKSEVQESATDILSESVDANGLDDSGSLEMSATADDAATIDMSELTSADDDIAASLDNIVSETSVATEEASPNTEFDSLDFNTDDLQVVGATEADTTSSNDITQDAPAVESPSAGANSGQAGDDPLQWDAIGTKLDLAKAYIDMGDAASASGLIDEAMREGNEQQRSQAAALAAQLPAS